MRMSPEEFEEKRREIGKNRTQNPANVVYQWVKEDRISPAQMVALAFLIKGNEILD